MRPVFAFLLLVSPLAAVEISVDPVQERDQLVVVSVNVDPATNLIFWEVNLDWKREEFENKVCFAAPPGKWKIGVAVVPHVDGKLGKKERATGVFEMPGTPVGPTPTPITDPPGPLAPVVPPGADRLAIAEFYRDLATVVELSTTIKTIGLFREAQKVAVQTMKETKRWPQFDGEINKKVSDRLVAAVGLDDSPLTPEKRTVLVVTLRAIAEDF